jgi:hypothetical protein
VTVAEARTSVSPADRPARAPWRPLLAWSLWALGLLCVAAMAWLDHLLRRAGRPDLAPLRSSDAVAYLVATLSATTVGALLGSRRPRHPVGWLLLGLGLSVIASGVATGYADYGLSARPGSLPAADYAALYTDLSVDIAAACLGFVLLLTPTGSPPTPRWRRWARVAAVAPVVAVLSALLLPIEPPFQSVPNPLAVPALAVPLEVVNVAAFVLTGLAIPVAAGSLVLRFRRARGVERLQLRWLALAAGLAAVAVLALAALVPTGNEVALGWVTAVAVALLPLATGAAVLRYRLYDLDRIISRTLAYGLLTVLLGGASTTDRECGSRRGGPGPRPAGRAQLAPAGRRRHPGGGQRLSARPPPRPGPGRPPLQPAPLRRRQDHRGIQHPAAPADRPRRPHRRTARRGGADDAAHQRIAVAASAPGRLSRALQDLDLGATISRAKLIARSCDWISSSFGG